jgi:hypothetical protein
MASSMLKGIGLVGLMTAALAVSCSSEPSAKDSTQVSGEGGEAGNGSASPGNGGDLAGDRSAGHAGAAGDDGSSHCVPILTEGSASGGTGPGENGPDCGDYTGPKALDLRIENGALECNTSRSDIDECKGEGTAVIYQLVDDHHQLLINFDVALFAGPVTEESLRSSFKYLDYEALVPHESGCAPYFYPLEVMNDLAAFGDFSFSDGHLHIGFTTKAAGAGRDLSLGMAAADSSQGQCSYTVDIPVTADFDLIFPAR